MSVDKDTVRRVARLARIAFPEERLEPMAGELNRIPARVQQLNAGHAAAVGPMTSVGTVSLKMGGDHVADGKRAAAAGGGAP